MKLMVMILFVMLSLAVAAPTLDDEIAEALQKGMPYHFNDHCLVVWKCIDNYMPPCFFIFWIIIVVKREHPTYAIKRSYDSLTEEEKRSFWSGLWKGVKGASKQAWDVTKSVAPQRLKALADQCKYFLCNL